MSENDLLILGAYLMIRDGNPDACDHCRHGDHHVCIRWGWNAEGCRCTHNAEETR